ncbi:glutaredoxin 3 [Duganella aceris]|uniref:Glutaredoxin n=1 Tax=Duganella aceris TaxID=2703883 RepID=A0ABX0FF17_9BURK|nr:glutaredoxin 3 [Duganella aceris]NGZ83143.1 glutaredoxin 3 [Duganella aceris]
MVTIYTSPSCAYCAMAKRLLAQKGVVATEIDIAADAGGMADMMRRSGRRTVPQVFIGERHVGGYDDLARLEREGGLDAALAA